jgi:hypothetical protein
VPATRGTKSLDVADPNTSTTFWEANTWAVQSGSLKSWKVTLPVGSRAPIRLAVLRTGVPTGPPGEAEARMSGDRRRTVMVNVWQAGALTRLLPHTVVGPNVPAIVGAPVRKPAGVSTSPGGSGAPLAVKTRSDDPVVNWWR